MIVTSVEPVTKTKYRICLDGHFAFVLYKGEVFRYNIKESSEVSEETYRDICENVLLKRAKLRAMHLLKDMDRTKKKLIEKLEMNGYPAEVIAEAVAYVERFGYINDQAFAYRVVENLKGKKSRPQIQAALISKGFERELIQEAMEHCYDREADKEAIYDFLRKRRYDAESADQKTKEKLIAVLIRRGFRYEDIRQVIQ